MSVYRGLGPPIPGDTLGCYVISESLEDGQCQVYALAEWLQRSVHAEETVLIRGFSRMMGWVRKRVRLSPPTMIDERRIEQLLAQIQRNIERSEEDRNEEIEDIIRELS